MQRLEVSGAVRPLQGSLGVKGLRTRTSTASLRKPTTHTEFITVIKTGNTVRGEWKKTECQN